VAGSGVLHGHRQRELTGHHDPNDMVRGSGIDRIPGAPGPCVTPRFPMSVRRRTGSCLHVSGPPVHSRGIPAILSLDETRPAYRLFPFLTRTLREQTSIHEWPGIPGACQAGNSVVGATRVWIGEIARGIFLQEAGNSAFAPACVPRVHATPSPRRAHVSSARLRNRSTP